MGDPRLATLAAQSHDQDVLLVELVYHQHVVQFDISAQELKYLPMSEIIDRYFSKAFADVHVVTAEHGETHAPALTSSSVTNV